jgi:hypothetical protein
MPNDSAQFLSLKKAIRKDLHFTKSARRDLAVARHLVACYLSSRAGLKELGILRTERTLQGDFAEWLVGHLLDIRLSLSTVEKHIDGVDRAGRTYQVKSRVVSSMSQSTSFDFRGSEIECDFLAAVFFDRSFEVLAVLRVPRDVVVALSTTTGSGLRFRWNRSCSNDCRVERIFWRETSTPAVGLGNVIETHEHVGDFKVW